MNPFLKSALTIGLGGLAAGLDSILASIVPTGGFATTLSAQPTLAIIFATAVVAGHNYLTKLEAQAGIHPAQTNAPAAH